MLLWNGWKVGTGPFSGSFNFPSRVRERLKPEFLVSALMALMAPDFTSCFACSVAVAVSTTGCSDSERLTPPWLVVLLLLCFFRASNAFFFFLSLLNFFCRASSSSLSPGGITNMVAPLAFPTPCLNQDAVQAPAGRDHPAFPPVSRDHRHQLLEEPCGSGRDKHPLRRQDDGTRPPYPRWGKDSGGVRTAEKAVEPA